MNWEKLLSEKRIRKSDPKDIRNPFESDYGRIIYSPALRRMHDKTQVFPLTTDDNIHSRLTHSNEVMSLGYTFGIKLCKSELIQKKTKKTELELMRVMPILLQSVCLIHDIGNAPFGHFAETIISEYFRNLEKSKKNSFRKLNGHQKRDFLFYDGNAQGLRVLIKLQYLNDIFGLNLTCATLASYMKYPNYEQINDKKGIMPIEKNKHGVFYSEKDFFESIIEECGLNIKGKILRHPLCYLMEAADSIAYLCMDMEDGFNKGLLDIECIKEVFRENKSKIATSILAICDKKFDDPNTKIVHMRITLISYLVDLAYINFEKNLDLIEVGKYNTELIEENNDILKELKHFSQKKIFTAREINYLESTGHSVIKGLLDFYIEFSFHENKKFVRKAEALISRSIIQCAIEECIIDIGNRKFKTQLNEKNTAIKKFKGESEFLRQLQKEKSDIESRFSDFNTLEKIYTTLFSKQLQKALTISEKETLLETKDKIRKIVEPCYNDLDNYYKFRVILDFISGMTDQYALNHYQKISGQKIN